jgi:serine/threonine-protein kinase
MTGDSTTGDLELGQLVDGKYRIERLLGKGGMGAVYTARHELLAQTVALKVVLPEIAANQEVVSRFINEARSVATIESDHVARVIDVGRLGDGTPYMVMEFLAGCDLDEYLARRGPLPPETIADFLLEALDGVAHAHALGIVHRDLKPANLFLSQKPGRPSRVKVLDFGIAKALEGSPLAASNATSTKSILGSPAFMAPEQLRSSRRVDARADIWSIGVIAYQLSTGRLPYDSEDVGGLFASILEDPALPPRQVRPELPEAFEAIVLRCLAKRPDERFQSALALATALAPLGTTTAARALERIQNVAAPPSEVPEAAPAPLAPATVNVTPDALAETHASSPSLERAVRKTDGNWAAPAPTPPPAPQVAKARSRWPLAAAGAVASLFLGLALLVGRRVDAPGRDGATAPPGSSPVSAPVAARAPEPPSAGEIAAAPPTTSSADLPTPPPIGRAVAPSSSARVKPAAKPTANRSSESSDEDLFQRH